MVHNPYMADWTPLRNALASVEDRVTYTWAELEEMIGGLPRSAYVYDAFWRGDRSRWRGFTAVDVKFHESVTFVRRVSGAAGIVVLVGCVKTKLDRSAPAQDLYTSPLFLKQRAYAESTGAPWFVLSAEHGLVRPETVLEPYERRLSAQPRDYRRAWGIRVVGQLTETIGPLDGKVVHLHAGSAYTDAIRDLLRSEGAEVEEPLRGLSLGKRLSWYRDGAPPAAPSSPASVDAPEVPELVERLCAPGSAVTPAEFQATGGAGLRTPGLYSWWVDRDGACELAAGLRHPVEPGLIYAGQAGATRPRSGRRSRNTLWGRIRSMHLGRRHEFSTFRRSLGSVLASAWDEPDIDEERLSAWMHRHLRLIAVPVDDADALGDLEAAVLAALDPPLNLSKMPRNPVRDRLTTLRRPHGRNSS